jgi:hypothetical protein
MKQISHGRAVSKIDMVNGHIFGEAGNVCLLDSPIVKIVEIIEDYDCVSGRQQVFDEMGADETGTACDQNSHVARSSTMKHAKCTKKIIFEGSGLFSSPRMWRLIPCRDHEKAL